MSIGNTPIMMGKPKITPFVNKRPMVFTNMKTPIFGENQGAIPNQLPDLDSASSRLNNRSVLNSIARKSLNLRDKNHLVLTP